MREDMEIPSEFAVRMMGQAQCMELLHRAENLGVDGHPEFIALWDDPDEAFLNRNGTRRKVKTSHAPVLQLQNRLIDYFQVPNIATRIQGATSPIPLSFPSLPTGFAYDVQNEQDENDDPELKMLNEEIQQLQSQSKKRRASLAESAASNQGLVLPSSSPLLSKFNNKHNTPSSNKKHRVAF
jgi:hypothetical protein